MIHYFKFRQDIFPPAPARDIYVKPGPGKGWPDECPPIRAAQGFGYDVLANFDVVFTYARGRWRVEPDIVLESDFNYAAAEDSDGAPLCQQYAWFWRKGQKLPHPITDNVYAKIRHQVKISTFLFLQSDPNEVLLMTEIPNSRRPWRGMTALIETDWYAAAHPWHTVIELDPSHKRISLKKGEPLCRLIPLRRDTYFAQPMQERQFDSYFAHSQQWLAAHGRTEHDEAAAGVRDITRTYVKQQIRSKFIVME